MTHPRFEKRFGKMRAWLSERKISAKLIFVIMGILATAWFLIRVIPKPSRAAYPCMKAAFPIMATFVLWLISFTGAFVAFKNMKKVFKKSGYLTAFALFVIGLVFSAIMINTGTLDIKAKPKSVEADVVHISNQPMGTPQGIFPGRVVWNHNPEATDETCTNTYEDRYVLDSNTDQAVVNDMIDKSIIALGGGKDAVSSWNAIFNHFNEKKGKGAVGYSTGESIFIKINEGTSSWYGVNWTEPERVTSKSAISETSPQVVQAILWQLIEVAGVPQSSIWVADPKSHLWDETFEKLSAVYPNVNYGDRNDKYVGAGNRTKLNVASEPSLFYSDKGAVMTTAVSEKYDEELINADYLINLAALKAHARAGITLTAKNHFGSLSRDAASHLHPGLVAPENDIVEREDYGLYRVQVDLMASSVLGGNTLLFLVDGLWGGTEAVKYPVKWKMEPFNNDWPSSIFMSLDQVALESVCFDFLRYEAEIGSEEWHDRPNFAQGVDDYLHQAADSKNWPEGIVYDPDNSGASIGSLGTHEHWNNPQKKQYSFNLGKFKGVELYAIPHTLVESAPFEAWEAETAPEIDGEGNDVAWATANWFYIDQLWIPWGENNIPATDFNGRFKVIWSPETNMIYFLAETEDDVFVDGYAGGGGYPNYDILEVFIDEDASGGPHVFDSGSENAENAFSYHIAVDLPADGESATTARVMDIAGQSWSNYFNPDYIDHFGAINVKRNGNKLTWEFSLKVYSDAYNHSNPEQSRVNLSAEKLMGISVAYCDNDNPDENPLTRDNFFGSVPVTQAAYNNHWMLADDYGQLTLKGAESLINHAPLATGTIDDYVFSTIDVTETAVPDLNTIFSDDDGDNLVFTVESSDVELVPEINGSSLMLTVSDAFSGPATVTVNASDGEFSAELSFTVTTTVSVALGKIQESLSVYPNPADSYLTLEFNSELNGEIFLRVIGINGQIHNALYCNKNESVFNKTLDISDLKSGVYFLEAHIKGEVIIRRFIK